MNYWKLEQDLNKTELRRAVPRLEALREQLKKIPAKDADGNLLLASWNIRDLGKPGGGFGYGERRPESYFYIAEILSRFDFVAVQEVNQLATWEKVMDVLGPHWGFIASDVTHEKIGGNDERLTYLYDKRKVTFRNVAGEIVLPPKMMVSQNEKGGRQFARTPYFASFQAGWRKFDICTVHIYYGSSSGAKLARRIDEINQIVKYLGSQGDEKVDAGKALILLGDFNVAGLKHKTMEALLKEGFVVPEEIQDPPEHQRNNFYDQIAFKTPPDSLVFPAGEKNTAGSFRIYENVFNAGQIDSYRKYFEPVRERTLQEARAKAKKNNKKAPKEQTPEEFYEDWRTWQLSDHQPLWIRLKADDSNHYLELLLQK
jgi:endonuclease/exonuclease/phosphatase family metal-dependent hydrolase